MRIRSLRRGIAAIVTAAAFIIGAAVPASAAEHTSVASQYLLTSRLHPGRPVQWLACRPIEYRVNTTAMPSGLLPTIRRAFATIQQQTGAKFRYAGHTTHTILTRTHAGTPTIYISFSHARTIRVPDGSVSGVAGWGTPWASYRSGPTGGTEGMLFGAVVLSTRQTIPAESAEDTMTWHSLLLHEVGHALDLAHRRSPHDVMYPEGGAMPQRYSAGELRALRRVLKTSGCDYAAWARL